MSISRQPPPDAASLSGLQPSSALHRSPLPSVRPRNREVSRRRTHPAAGTELGVRAAPIACVTAADPNRDFHAVDWNETQMIIYTHRAQRKLWTKSSSQRISKRLSDGWRKRNIPFRHVRHRRLNLSEPSERLICFHDRTLPSDFRRRRRLQPGQQPEPPPWSEEAVPTGGMKSFDHPGER